MNTRIGIASLLCASVSLAQASTLVKEYDQSGSLIATRSIGNSDIEISLDLGTVFVDILPSDNTTTIPKLTFVGGPDFGVVSFYLGSDENTTGPDFLNQDVAPVKRGGMLKGIVAMGLGDHDNSNGLTTSIFYGGIVGSFGEPCGDPDDDDCENQYTIRVNQLVRFDVGDEIYGDFAIGTPGGTTSSPIFVIEGGRFSDTCDITLNSGTIKRIESVGDMKARIEVRNGDIDLIDAGARITGYGLSPIWVWRGKIGTITFGTHLAQFSGAGTGEPMIRANEGIDYILYKYPSGAAREDGYINAYIVANDTTYDTTVTDGSIRKIDCFALYNFSQPDPNIKTQIIASKFKKAGTDSGIFVGTGVQDGLLKATGNAESEIIFGGDVLANGTSPAIEIGGSLIDDTTLDGSLVIGGSLAGKVKLGAQGLKGQVIINANDASETWTGDVVIGSTTISTSTSGFPYYNIASSGLGGGAIGLVPFHLYNVDCSPQNSASQSTAEEMLVTEFMRPNPDTNTITSKSIKLRFYGPVRTDATAGNANQPIYFEELVSGIYQDRTSLVDITMRRAANEPWSREIEIKGKSGSAVMHGFYRVRPRLSGADRLYCDELGLAQPPSVGDFEYFIELREDCNVNGEDDGAEIDDDWWMDVHPMDGRLDWCQGCGPDVDGNGFVNGNDYDLFSAWFEDSDPAADYNGDTFVNADDYDAFSYQFEMGCHQ